MVSTPVLTPCKVEPNIIHMGEPGVIQPTHVIAKLDGGRQKNTTVRSYLMEIPSKRLTEAFRIYSCLLDDIYGLDFKNSGIDKLPEAKQPSARANAAKARAGVARVALEALDMMGKLAKLQDPKGTGIKGHIVDVETAKEGMSLEQTQEMIAKNKAVLGALEKKEEELIASDS